MNHEEQILVGLAAIAVLGVGAQWLAWRLRLPSILLLLGVGFVAGPLTDFGPSNFWIAFVVMAAWEGWQWPAAHTVAGSMTEQHIAMLDGTRQSPIRVALALASA